MTRLYIPALLLLSAATAAKVPTFPDRIGNIFGAKCLKNAGQIEREEFMKELANVKKCLTFNLKPGTGEEIGKQCLLYTETATKCVATFAEKLEHCLNPEEKYLKQFVIEVYSSSVKDCCNYTQMMSVKPELHSETKKCMAKLNDKPNINPHLVCFENSAIIGDNPTEDLITKEELCSDIQHINACYTALLSKHCPESADVREYQKHFSNAGLNHCKHAIQDSSVSDESEESEEE